MGNHAGMQRPTYGHHLYTHLPPGAAVFEMSARLRGVLLLPVFPSAAIMFPSSRGLKEHILFPRSFLAANFRGLSFLCCNMLLWLECEVAHVNAR